MNQINRQRSARWVIAFGSILEIDRSRHLCAREKPNPVNKLKPKHANPAIKKEKQHEQV